MAETQTDVGGATSLAFWAAQVVVTGLSQRGLVNGAPAPTYVTNITWHNHTEVRFTMPPVEGSVSVQLLLKSLQAESVLSANALTFTADPPTISAVAAIVNNVADADDDPCAALNVSTASCVTFARNNVSDWGSYPLNVSRPCFRAGAAANGAMTQLSIRGANFGSGKSDGMAVRVGGVACDPIGQSVYVNDTALQCRMSAPLPRGPADVNVTVAYRTVTASAFGIQPQAVCRCGQFADNNSAYCEPCPPGASCAGAYDKPRALKDYWETFEKQWEEERDINLNDSQFKDVTRFMPCAVKGLCDSDQRCSNTSGSTGWMCVRCMDKHRRSYDGRCHECKPEEVLITQAVAGGFIAAIVIVGGTFVALKPKLPSCEAPRACKSCCPRPRPALVSKPVSSVRTGDVGMVTLLKVGATFGQTLAALAAYAQPSKLQAPQEGDPQYLPQFLQNFRFLGDFGLSYKTIQCATSVSYTTKLVVYMVAPAVTIVGVPAVFLLGGFAATRKPVWRLIFGPDSAPPSMSEVVKSASFYASFLTFIVLPPSISALANAQNCAADSAGKFLVDYPEISCASPSYKALQHVALILGYVYLAAPALVGLLLLPLPGIPFLAPCCGRAEDEEKRIKRVKRVRRTFKFLWDGYATKEDEDYRPPPGTAQRTSWSYVSSRLLLSAFGWSFRRLQLSPSALKPPSPTHAHTAPHTHAWARAFIYRSRGSASSCCARRSSWACRRAFSSSRTRAPVSVREGAV